MKKSELLLLLAKMAYEFEKELEKRSDKVIHTISDGTKYIYLIKRPKLVITYRNKYTPTILDTLTVKYVGTDSATKQYFYAYSTTYGHCAYFNITTEFIDSIETITKKGE